MADYSLFLYLSYLGLSLLVGAVAISTFIWMMNAWRTPESLEADGRKDNGQPTKHSFSLIVPARDEELVLPNTLARIMGSDHPDFEVLVVVGDNDPGTQAVAEQMADQHPDRIKVVVYSASPKSKPKALNAALQHCSGEITGIFDAEDDVHPALLRRVDQAFSATEADVVQAGVQLMNLRSHWFTVHNVLEYYFWFRSRLHVHARQRFIPLGGNTVFVRTAVLNSVGGWYDCLTEDCEIGVRLSTMGAHTAVFYEPELVTREECPPTVRDFIKQRTRWNQGFLQTLGRGYWRRLPLRERALGVYILSNPYIMALSWLMIPAAFATAVLIKEPVGITLLSFLPLLPMLGMLAAEGVAIAEFCRTYGMRARAVDYLRLVVGLLPYQALLAYAAGRAVIRQARGTNSWHKTTHLGQHLSKAAVADATVVGATATATVGGDPPRAAARVLLAEPPAAGGDLVPTPRPGNGPLWTRLDTMPELGPPAREEPDGPAGPPPASPRRAPRAALAGAWWWLQGRRIDLSVQLVLLVIAGIVLITNLTHWPATQFDEGTYVSYGWALTRGRLANYTYSYGHPPLGWMLIFVWTEAQGLFGRVVFSIDHARELMALVFLVSCSLLYTLARRLGFSWPAAAAAVLAMALAPIGVFFHRAVLLDNPSITLAIAAFVLAWDPRRRLWAFVGSGACFALSVLCKETTFDLLPAVLFAVVQNADRRTRVYCVTLFLAAFAIVGGFFPLYATLKHELIPGPGHVSLLGYLIVQLVTRKASGSVLNAQSQSHQEVLSWLQLDPWLLCAALALIPLALMRRSTRAIALALLIQVAVVLKPGYLPNMYVIGMLPFAALIVPGSLDALWRWAGQMRFSALTWAARTAVAACAVLAVAFVGPRWAAGDHTAMTVRMDIPERSAELWLTGHVSRSSRIIVVDQYWLYLIEHGYNDQPMPGGFYSDTVVSYWPLDYDPAVIKAFPDRWREFNYVVVNEDMLSTLPQTQSAADAIAHSQVVASFGQGLDRVQIRKINPTGLN